MSYTAAACVGVVVAVLLDLAVFRTRLLLGREYWIAYAIILFFQLVTNGILTGVPVVRYDPGQILGPRIVFAPLEDVLFGFSLILTTLSVWTWTGRRERPADR